MTTFVFGTNTWTDETKPFASIWYLVTSKEVCTRIKIYLKSMPEIWVAVKITNTNF